MSNQPVLQVNFAGLCLLGRWVFIKYNGLYSLECSSIEDQVMICCEVTRKISHMQLLLITHKPLVTHKCTFLLHLSWDVLEELQSIPGIVLSFCCLEIVDRAEVGDARSCFVQICSEISWM